MQNVLVLRTIRAIFCSLPLTGSMRLWALFHTGTNIRRNMEGTSYVIDLHISLCVIRPLMSMGKEHTIKVYIDWLRDVSRIPVRERQEMQTGIETLTVEWRSAKTLGHFMYETGPDRSKRRIGGPKTQCDMKAHIYCVYCACITNSSVKYYLYVWKKTFA